MSRQLLVVQVAASSLDVGPRLTERGWQVERAFDVDSVLGDAASARASIGIVVFDPEDAHDLAKVRRLVAGPRQWVAIVHREATRRPDLARLVAEGFVDFHTLPLDLDRLTVILGHVAGRIALQRSLPEEAKPDSEAQPRTSLLSARQSTERDAVLRALERNRQNMSAAARDLGISRVTLYRMLQRLDIERPPTRMLDLPGRVPRGKTPGSNLPRDRL